MSKFSIILPVFNNEKKLKKFLENLFNQTHKDFELICVDDGSTDNSLQILQDYAQKDSKIKIITQVQRGNANARNVALEVATGDFCYFANVSDLLAPSLFEYANILFSSFNIDYFCFGSKVVKDEEAITLNTQKLQEELLIKQDGLYDLTFDLAKKHNVGIFNKIFKLSVIKNNNIRFPEDSEKGDIAFVWLYNFVSQKVYFDDCIYQYHKVFIEPQNKDFAQAVSYLKSWYFVFEQMRSVKGLIKQNFDNLVELLNEYTVKTKLLVAPVEKYKIEMLKQEYYDKLYEVILSVEREQQRIRQLEFERTSVEERASSADVSVVKECNLKKNFFQKIFSNLPDPSRKNCRILTIFGIEILLHDKA